MDAAWLSARTPDVPRVLGDVLDSVSERTPDPEQAAQMLLDEAVAESASRTGAWPLLGADALLTYLCEHAVEVEAEPEIRLAELARLCVGGL